MRRLAGVAAAVALAAASAACSTGDDLEPMQARLRTPDQRATLEVDGCAREGDIVALGASSESVLVQLLLTVDGDEVDLAASGLTVELADGGVLGAGDAELIQAETGDAGELRSASVRGDRIEVVADAVRVTPEGTVTEGEVELTARCTADDDLA